MMGGYDDRSDDGDCIRRKPQMIDHTAGLATGFGSPLLPGMHTQLTD